MNPMDRSVVSAIAKAQADLNEDSMTNILDSVINKKDLDEVREILKRAYTGDTIVNHGKYFYNEMVQILISEIFRLVLNHLAL